MSEWTPLQREAPYQYLRTAIEMFNQRNGIVIVEIGCMRQRFNHPINQEPVDCPSRLDGHSTAHFADSGAEFYSVDINKAAIQIAQECIAPNPKTRMFCMDGLKFLRNFTKRIDLLFLDAWDVDLLDCAEKHLEAYKIAKKNLDENSLILIDDCDVSMVDRKLSPAVVPYGGKGELVVQEAMNDGWKVLKSGRCVLLGMQ